MAREITPTEMEDGDVAVLDDFGFPCYHTHECLGCGHIWHTEVVTTRVGMSRRHCPQGCESSKMSSAWFTPQGEPYQVCWILYSYADHRRTNP